MYKLLFFFVINNKDFVCFSYKVLDCFCLDSSHFSSFLGHIKGFCFLFIYSEFTGIIYNINIGIRTWPCILFTHIYLRPSIKRKPKYFSKRFISTRTFSAVRKNRFAHIPHFCAVFSWKKRTNIAEKVARENWCKFRAKNLRRKPYLEQTRARFLRFKL